MAGAHKGYGPPRIESFRAVRLAAEERSFLADAQAGPAPLLRFEVRGEEAFLLRGMPLMIQVGDRGYLASEMSADGRSISCTLDEIPEEGAIIRVGYPPDQMTELPERFSLSMLEPAGPGDSA